MSTSDLPPNPSGTPTPAGSGRGDFTTPVELRCVMTPTGELKRAIPLTIVTFLFAGFVALVVIGIALNPPAPVAFGGAVVVGAIVAGFAYLRTWSRLRRVYGEQQRLLLTPQGLRRTDGTLLIDMPWASILRLEERNSALSTRKAGVIAGPAGMVANAGIPRPNARSPWESSATPSSRRCPMLCAPNCAPTTASTADSRIWLVDSPSHPTADSSSQPSSKRIGRRARSAPGSGTTVRTWVYPTECPNLESPLISG